MSASAALVFLTSVAPVAAAAAPYFWLRKDGRSKVDTSALVGASAGVLLGIAFLDLIPEAAHLLSKDATFAYVGVPLGYLVLLAVTRALETRGFGHSHAVPSDDVSDEEASPAPTSTVAEHASAAPDCNLRASAMLPALYGLAVHSFIDGLIVSTAFGAGASVGIRITLAIVIHKVPDGFVLASVVLSMPQGKMAREAFKIIGVVSACTPVGIVIGYVLLSGAPQQVLAFFLFVGAGSFVFVAATVVVPEVVLHGTSPARGTRNIAVGLVGYIVLREVSEVVLGGHEHA